MRHPSRVAAIVTIGSPPPKDWQEGYRAKRIACMTVKERLFFEDHRYRRNAGDPISDEDEQRWANLSWRADFVDPAVAEQHAPPFSFR
jgi:hypothetical protein